MKSLSMAILCIGCLIAAAVGVDLFLCVLICWMGLIAIIGD